MSKSSSNTVSPAEVIEKSGADILRLWVASSDYSEDLKIGPEIIKSNIDSYRRLRNTLRFILGNLSDFDQDEKVSVDELDELDLYILSELESLKKEVISNYKIFEYQKVFSAIFNFCTNDLSSFYFDIRKDTLYCDSKNNKVRKSTRTVLDILFHDLLSLLAPILCFTTEEAWQSRFGFENSIHEKDFPKLNDTLINKNLSTKWAVYKKLRKVINGAIEVKRKEKVLGSSLEASVKLYISKDEIEKIDQKVLENISIISELEIVNDKPSGDSFISEVDKNIGVHVSKTDGEKCERCWKYFSNLKDNVCDRCQEVLCK